MKIAPSQNKRHGSRTVKSLLLTAVSFLFVACGASTPTALPTLAPSIIPTPFGGGTGRIAFVTYRDGNYEVYLMNADGSEQVNLTNSASSDEHHPVWSPDGTKMVFSAHRSNPALNHRYNSTEVYVIDADGSGEIKLTTTLESWGENKDPTWSPNGKQIAFVSNRDGNYEIYLMNADGSGQVNLTNNQATNEGSPTWSPDGTRIAFDSALRPESFDSDNSSEIYVINVDGSNLTNLTNNPALDEHPDWSPDGKKIAFVSERDGRFNFEIYIMNIDGTEQINLTNQSAIEVDDYPAWSPDGQHITFYSSRDDIDNISDNFEIYIMNADGSMQTRLTNNSGDDSWTAWQP